jgi:hypothetical protein
MSAADLSKENELLKKSNKLQAENIELLKKTGKIANDAFKKAAEGTKYFGNKLEYAENTLEKLAKELRKKHIEKGLSAKTVAGLNKQMKELETRSEKIKNAVPKKGSVFNTSELSHNKKELNAINKGTRVLDKTIKGGNRYYAERMASMSEGAGAFKSLFSSLKGSPKDMQATAESAGIMADKLKSMGGLAKGLGGALGGVSKIFGGPAGIALMAGKALFDMTIQADTFVKNANKAFASVRGPDIETDDVEKQFKEFNDQIYSSAETIKTGLGAEAMKGFLEAVSQTGYNITQFQGGLTSYTDAIETAAKASKILGVDVVQAGGFMGTLGMDYRENLDEMGKSFNQLAFDAKKSGLSTANFWNVVQNATSSLTLYGVKMDAAGKIFSAFTHSQVGGAKDAAAAAEGMMGVFTNVDRKQNAIAMSMMEKGVPGILSKTYKGMAAGAGTKAAGIKEQILKVEAMEPNQENLEALNRLHTDLTNAEKDQANYSKAELMAQQGQYVQLGTYFGDLANKASTLVPAMIKGILPSFTNMGKIDETNQTLLEQISDMTNLSVPALRGIIKNGQFANTELKDLSENIEKNGDKLLDQASKDNIGTAIKEMDTGNEKGFDDLTEAFKKTGMDPVSAKELAHLVKYNGAIKEAVKKTLLLDKKDGKIQIKELQKLITSDEVGNQATFEDITSGDKSDNVMEKKSTDTFKKIKNLTLSNQEIMDSMGDEVKYRTYSAGLFKSMNTGITAIAKFLTKTFGHLTGTPEYQTQEEIDDAAEKAAQETAAKEGNIATKGQGYITPEQIKGGAVSAFGYSSRQAQEAPEKMASLIQHESGGYNYAQPGISKMGKTPSGPINPNTGKPSMPTTAYGAAQFTKETAEGILKGHLEDFGGKGAHLPKWENLGTGTGAAAGGTGIPDWRMASKQDTKGLVDLSDPAVSAKMLGFEMHDLMKKHPDWGWDELMAAHYQGEPAVITAKAKAKTSGGNWKDLMVTKQAVPGQGPSTAAYLADANRATMGMPEKVTAPGMVKLHPGESIFPNANNSKLRTTPLLNDTAMNNAMGTTGGGEKTININVSADTKDLAQKIANEVRGVLYKTQLTGVA